MSKLIEIRAGTIEGPDIVVVLDGSLLDDLQAELDRRWERLLRLCGEG